MIQEKQQDLMLRFSRCVFKDDAESYAEADCWGATRIILRDFGGLILPSDRHAWRECFEFVAWPTELRDFDVVLMAYANRHDLIDHMATHIGDGWLAHIGRFTGGMVCDRLNKYESRIVNVARYRK